MKVKCKMIEAIVFTRKGVTNKAQEVCIYNY